jgi:glycosyltransferase involved in cell wall biosynthesis
MNIDFKIYVTTLDEERLIPYTIEALLKVFPKEQIEVIDLGSKDRTLHRIPEGVRVHNVILPEDGTSGQYFTDLKNYYSKRQEWVLWVDGDEIYPYDSLHRIKDWLYRADEHGQKTVRLYWKVLKEQDGDIYCSNEYLSAGPKLFNSNYQRFRRAWPDEVTVRYKECSPPGSKSEFNGFWFWHGVLLNRSDARERTARYKKRLSKTDRYNRHMTWEKLKSAPWETDYASRSPREWTVVHMDLHNLDADTVKWSGKLG